MNEELKKRILNICDELGEEMDSPNCRKLREHVQSCPDSQAFVDSVKKTIQLYRAYEPASGSQTRAKLFERLGLK